MLGERIREIRKAKGWSQKVLADRFGCDPTLISQYETGAREPAFKNVIKLCEALGCMPNDLISLENEIKTCPMCHGAGIVFRKVKT